MDSSIDSNASVAFQSLRPRACGRRPASPYVSYNDSHRYTDERAARTRCATSATLPCVSHKCSTANARRVWSFSRLLRTTRSNRRLTARVISITLCFIRAASSTLRFSLATDLIAEGRPSSVLIYISAQLF